MFRYDLNIPPDPNIPPLQKFLVEKEKPPFVTKASRSGDVNLLQF
jgi:hypothetical protein